MPSTTAGSKQNLGGPAPIGRSSIPLVEHHSVSLSASDRTRVDAIAARLIADEPAFQSTDAFGPRVGPGMLEGPAVLIGDHREIALATPAVAETYEYRLAVLAARGDIILMSGNRNPVFENYLQAYLDIGAIDVIELPQKGRDGRKPLAQRCQTDKCALDSIVAKARRGAGLTIIPHIGTGSAWTLAGLVSDLAGVPVRVAAPPPRLTRRVNDKLWFARRVADLLERPAHPPFRSAYGPAALAAQMARLAGRSERVVVKVPDSAGSSGNVCLMAKDVEKQSLTELRNNLLSILRGLGWRDRFPLLVEIWDSDVLANPSVQTWIPSTGDGDPIIEGIFEQIVEGAEGKFVGSVAAALPDLWERAIVGEAFRLAMLFQRLGYFGRCSFDAVIAGESYAQADLHWIECNGRWGGVSIPMTLANRLTGDWQRHPFVVVQRAHLAMKAREFVQILETLDDDLFRVAQDLHGVVLLSPLGFEQGTAINLMAISDSVEAAKDLAGRSTRALKNEVRH